MKIHDQSTNFLNIVWTWAKELNKLTIKNYKKWANVPLNFITSQFIYKKKEIVVSHESHNNGHKNS